MQRHETEKIRRDASNPEERGRKKGASIIGQGKKNKSKFETKKERGCTKRQGQEKEEGGREGQG